MTRRFPRALGGVMDSVALRGLSGLSAIEVQEARDQFLTAIAELPRTLRVR